MSFLFVCRRCGNGLEDIGDLTRHFLRVANKEGLSNKEVETAAIERMRSYSWPGNVRELENFVRRISALYPQDVITADIVDAELSESAAPRHDASSEPARNLSEMVERYLADYFAQFGAGLPPVGLYDRIVEQVEAPLIVATLSATRGNQIKAAELLNINRNTLRKKIRDLDIRVFRTPR